MVQTVLFPPCLVLNIFIIGKVFHRWGKPYVNRLEPKISRSRLRGFDDVQIFLWDIVGEVLSHLLRQLESKDRSLLWRNWKHILIHVGLEDSEDLITDLDSAFKRL